MATETYVRVPSVILARIRSAVETLDWKEFRARSFPGARDRHDFEALVAYGAYRRDDRQRRTGEPSGDAMGIRTHDHGHVARSAGLSAWENEGGAAPS